MFLLKILPIRAPKTQLSDFYCRNGADRRGRTFNDILKFDDTDFERLHDFNQWLFPTVTKSRFNFKAPTLDATTILQLRSDATAQQRLCRAFARTLAFYGLVRDQSDTTVPRICPSPLFESRSLIWRTPRNHNYRRLTRILESLTALGRQDLADALYLCLERCDQDGQIGEDAMAHWRRQLGR